MAKATIDDVAELSGFSIKTVSRVVNNEPNVRQSTRDKVMAAVDKLGYRPNLSARSLAASRSYVFGLLYDNPSANYVIDVQDGVLSVCRPQGYDLLIHPCSHRDVRLKDEILDLVRQTRVDGLILTPPITDLPELVQALCAADFPFVRIAPANHKELAPYVETNDWQAAYDMTCKLIGLGHKRIGFVRGHPDHHAVAFRYEGYRAALADKGLPFDESLVEQGFNSFESGEKAGRRFLQRPNRPTAVFAGNDDMAAGVMMVAHQLDLRIPMDLSVAGFDDTPVAHQIWPALTTVRQPIRAMAQQATQLLLDRARGGDTGAASKALSSSLILRESTGPAPRSI